MKIESAYLIGEHAYSHRCGEPAKIIGVGYITPKNLEKRLCYHVMWEDGVEDWVPVEDNGNYRVITPEAAGFKDREKTMEEKIEEFCKRAKISVAQFHGDEPIDGDLNLNWAEELPEGFTPIISGFLSLDGLRKISDGFDPIVGWSLSLDGLEEVPKWFDPIVALNISLNGLKSIPEGFNPRVGYDIFLNGLESIPEGFKPVAGNSLWVDSVKTFPESFNPTLGGRLYAKNVESIPERLETKNLRRPSMIAQTKNEKYIILMGSNEKHIMLERCKILEKIHESGMMIKGRGITGYTIWIYGMGNVSAYGNTLEEAKGKYEAKVAELMRIHEVVKKVRKTQMVTPLDYSIITGIRQRRVDNFIKRKGFFGREAFSIGEFLELSKGEEGHDRYRIVLGV